MDLNNVQVYGLILEVLRHIKSVESEVMEKSLQAALAFGDALNNSKIEQSPELIGALQYQDIMSQQLSATIEAIDSIEKSLALWLHSYHNDTTMLQDNLVKLDEKLKTSLEDAKQKKAAFSGRDGDCAAEVEFF